MIFQSVKPRNLVLSFTMFLLAGCLTEQEQSNFADTGENRAPTIGGNPPTSVDLGQNYDFTPTATDPDGDQMSFEVANLPVWASFDTTTGQLSGTPASAGDFENIRISVSDGQATSSLDAFAISVNDNGGLPTNSAPTISGTPTLNTAANQPYSFTPTAADADGDTLTFAIENQPAWATFDTSNGQLSGTPTNAGVFADIRISVSDGQASAGLPTFTITVSVSNNAPTISGTPGNSVEVGEAYSFVPSAADADGDTLTFQMLNQPVWAAFDTATGALTGTPPSGSAGVYADIEISVTDGQANASLAPFVITVTDNSGVPTNNAPTISGIPATTVQVGDLYTFTPNASDADGDTLTFSISNAPGWASFDTATGQLSGQPASAGNFANILISVSDGQESASLAAFSIDVTDDNSAPTISGSPATAVQVGDSYAFTPNASDPDGDTLSFSVTNLPGWASFDTSTGSLSGTPTASDTGSYTGIVITVSDGQDSTSLASFRIDVTDDNTAPTISGNPATSVQVGQPYTFTPSANDADGDTLTFSITNLPAWASFDTTTGRLSGTPADTDAGSYAGIVISVSDGEDSASLSSFSIDVTQITLRSTTLTWTAPTRNEDGTTLDDLAAYKIYYGTSSRNYTNEIAIDNPGITTFVVDNLSPATYYFVITAIDATDEESAYSGELVRDLN